MNPVKGLGIIHGGMWDGNTLYLGILQKHYEHIILRSPFMKEYYQNQNEHSVFVKLSLFWNIEKGLFVACI